MEPPREQHLRECLSCPLHQLPAIGWCPSSGALYCEHCAPEIKDQPDNKTCGEIQAYAPLRIDEKEFYEIKNAIERNERRIKYYSKVQRTAKEKLVRLVGPEAARVKLEELPEYLTKKWQRVSRDIHGSAELLDGLPRIMPSQLLDTTCQGACWLLDIVDSLREETLKSLEVAKELHRYIQKCSNMISYANARKEQLSYLSQFDSSHRFGKLEERTLRGLAHIENGILQALPYIEAPPSIHSRMKEFKRTRFVVIEREEYEKLLQKVHEVEERSGAASPSPVASNPSVESFDNSQKSQSNTLSKDSVEEKAEPEEQENQQKEPESKE